MCIYSLRPGHLEDGENDGKEKRSKLKKKGVKKRKSLVQRSSARENHHRSVAEGPRLEKKW